MATDKQQKLPGVYKAFTGKFPKLHEAHELVNEAAGAAGPLDAKTCLLVKVGVCVGAKLESATRANVRKAMAAGATQEEIEQAILQAMNTVGFPSTVAAWSWAQQQFERGV
jgi:alkylhydroperoxidase/carboxymuconolactone decarboxylase family protein YurZ